VAAGFRAKCAWNAAGAEAATTATRGLVAKGALVSACTASAAAATLWVTAERAFDSTVTDSATCTLSLSKRDKSHVNETLHLAVVEWCACKLENYNQRSCNLD
jgi:hypothetical protein